MKNITGLLLIAGLFLMGCQTDVDQEAGLEGSEFQILLEESAMRDSAMLELMTTLNLIDQNITKISDRQNQIDINANDVEFRETYRERMLDDIQDIFEMMETNKNRIADLNARLADARNKLGSANKENERLVKLLDQYQVMINNLNSKLDSKDQEIYNLNEKLVMMDISLDSLKAEVHAKHLEMNKVYYAFGTKKELMYHNIIDKSGGFIGIGKTYQLKDDFNKEYFTIANAEELKEIELYVKEVNILSAHNEKSYHFEGESKVEKLIIDDPAVFWEASKFLVIEVKQ